VRLDPRADSIAVTLAEGDANDPPDATAGNDRSAMRDQLRRPICRRNCRDARQSQLSHLSRAREYCELVRAKSYLVNNLVYPLPHTDGLSLGVHLTRTLWGTVLVGPRADYISGKNDYERNRLPVEEFVRRAKPMLPEIEAVDLQLAYSGIRAKLVPPGHGGVARLRDHSDAAVPRAIQVDRDRVSRPERHAGDCRESRLAGAEILQ